MTVLGGTLGSSPLGGLAGGALALPPVVSTDGDGPRVEVQLTPGTWTSLKADLLTAYTFSWWRGASDPLDHVADTGTLEFSLRNDVGNSGGTLGWYSPNHVNVRSGWTQGKPIRVVWTVSATDYPLWTGKLASVTPIPGIQGERRVQCLGVDVMNDLAETDVRSVSPQVNQTENAILAAIFAAMPTSAQPSGVSYDTSLDTYPYALWNASSDVKAMSLLVDVMNSCQGYLYPLAGGGLRVENRQARTLLASSYVFEDATLVDLVVPSDLTNVFNRVRCVTHPVTVDDAATTVLFGVTGVNAIPAGDTITIWGDYASPDNSQQLIGGTAQVTSLVAGTDYAGNTLEDGSGSDVTADIDVVATAFAAAVKFEVTNTGGSTAYLVDASGVPLLQLRGKGIYDNAPASFEASSVQDYGDRLLVIDLPYQSNGAVAQDRATFLEGQYNNRASQIAAISFIATRSSALLMQAVTGEIGSVVTASETVTGISDVDAAIQGIRMDMLGGTALQVTYLTAPRVAITAFIWDDPVYGVWDDPVAVWGFG